MSSLRSRALAASLLALPLASQDVPPAVEHALVQLAAPGTPARLRAMRDLERAGPAAVPAMLQRLQELVRNLPREAVHSQALFIQTDEDDVYTSLDDVALLWPEPVAEMFFDLEDAATLQEGADHYRRDLAAVGGPEGVRLRLLFLLMRAGAHAADAVPLMIDLLAQEDLAVDAAHVLVAIGEPAVPALLEVLGDRVRGFAAAETLAALQGGRSAALVRDPVTELLSDRRRRDRALAVLAHLGPGCGKAQAAAVAAIARTASGLTPRFCAWALGRMGAVAVPELQGLLREDLGVQRHTLVLGAAMLLGTQARALVPDVLALVPSGLPRIQLANALGALAPGSRQEAAVVDLLVNQCRDGWLVEQAAAARALGAFPDHARASVPVLTAFVTDEGYLLRRIAVESLGALGPGAAAASAAVLAVATAEQGHVDRLTLGTLARLGVVDVGEARQRSDECSERLDTELRESAVRALGAVDRDALPRLVAWLDDERLGDAAADALVAAGPGAVAALRPLLDDAGRGRAAAHVLGRIGGPGVEVLFAALEGDGPGAANAESALSWTDANVARRLIAMLRNGREGERDVAARILADRDLSELRRREADSLIVAAQKAPPARRADLVTALETVETERAIAFLVQCTADQDGEVRLRAVSGLGDYQDVDRDDVRKALRLALDDRLPGVRAAAAWAFVGSLAEDAAVRDRLLALRDDDLVDVREAALAALGAFGGSCASILPVLEAALDDSSAGVRAGALRGFAGLGVGAAASLDDVLRRLRDRDARVRVLAAEALGALRPDLGEAAWELRDLVVEEAVGLGGGGWNSAVGVGWSPGLAEELRAALAADDVRQLHRALVRLLPLAGAEEAAALRAPVESLLTHADAGVREQAATVLWRMVGPEAAMPVVVPLLQDPAPAVRAAMARLLRGCGVARAEAAITAIAPLAADPAAAVRVEVLAALGVLAADSDALARRVEPLLCAGLGDGAADVRRAAAGSCARLSPPGAATVAALTAVLGDDDQDVVQAAVRALGRAGRAAAAAVPRLLELGRASAADVRGASIEALARIAPDRTDVLLLAVEALQDEEVAGEARSAWTWYLVPR